MTDTKQQECTIIRSASGAGSHLAIDFCPLHHGTPFLRVEGASVLSRESDNQLMIRCYGDRRDDTGEDLLLFSAVLAPTHTVWIGDVVSINGVLTEFCWRTDDSLEGVGTPDCLPHGPISNVDMADLHGIARPMMMVTALFSFCETA